MSNSPRRPGLHMEAGFCVGDVSVSRLNLHPAKKCNINCYMRGDVRFSTILHLLMHMAHSDRPLTSGELGDFSHTNPVVVRRELALPRVMGIVTSSRGRGSGWTLAKDPADISLLEIYRSTGIQSLFTISFREESDGCKLNNAVDNLLSTTLDDMEVLFHHRLSNITLADVLAIGPTKTETESIRA